MQVVRHEATLEEMDLGDERAVLCCRIGTRHPIWKLPVARVNECKVARTPYRQAVTEECAMVTAQKRAGYARVWRITDWSLPTMNYLNGEHTLKETL